MNRFWLLILTNESCKLSENFSKDSKEQLGDEFKEMKLHNFPPIKISNIKNSCRYENQLISKQGNVHNIQKHHFSYY